MIYVCRVMAFWNVMLCSLEDTHQRFRGPCCFHLWNRRVPLKHLCQSVILHGVTSKKLILLTFSCLMTHTYIYIYICRTAQLTSRCCILYIYSTNICTEYLNMLHTLFFPLQNAVYFIMLPFFGPCIIHILNTECAKT